MTGGTSGETGNDWVSIISAVARALARERHEPDQQGMAEQSLLAALTGEPLQPLRHRLRRLHEQGSGADLAADPLVHQYQLPLYLLGKHIVQAAAFAAAGCTPADFAQLSEDDRQRYRTIGIVTVAALSTLTPGGGVELSGELNGQVGRLVQPFGQGEWTTALDQLVARTAELHALMLAADNDRRHTWRGVDLADRILAEALAGAVVGGAADASKVPPERWRFPFHILCHLGLSAAQDGLAVIEDWIGIEFLPLPRTSERAASLAVLVAEQASQLHIGCQCKADADPDEVAFVPRGPCRQSDHDLRAWMPGLAKPGGRGGRYAATLWGWLRRWLGGTNADRAARTGLAGGRARLRPNDVAGCVLARQWLHADRGLGGPCLLYDRILPEYCQNCHRPAHVEIRTEPGKAPIVGRQRCCDQPKRVYRSDFTARAGRRVMRPKLGIIVVSPHGGGYRSTQPLGPLWLCSTSGRYFLAAEYCPDCGLTTPTGPTNAVGRHEPVRHGWVLLPLDDAWKDLVSPARPQAPEYEQAPPSASAPISDAELNLLQQAFSTMNPKYAHQIRTLPDVLSVIRTWSREEMQQFLAAAGLTGLQLLLRCKQAAEALPSGDDGETTGGSDGDD